MVSERTRELIKKDAKYFIHPFGQAGLEPQVIWERAEGIRLWDTEGKEYLDFCSQWQCSNLGYGRKELIDAAIEQMNKLEYVCQPNPYSTIPAIEYAEKLAKFTPRNINHFFYTVAGTEANETAIKLAKFYWYLKGKATKYKVICLSHAYHGTGLMTSSLSGYPPLRNYFGPEAPGVIRVPFYHCYRCDLGLKYLGCGVACARYLETAIEQEGEDTVAAFIVEPLQGGGAGGIAPPPEYFPMVREICTKHNVLFIDDEVMMGFCRTGRNFTIDHWNVEPDFITMGKGINCVIIPMGVVGICDKVYEELEGKEIGSGSTHAGHPVACAVAKVALDIYIRERLAENAAKVGKHIRERLEREFLPLPHVGEVNGLGLMLSFEIVSDKPTKTPLSLKAVMKMRNKVLENGVYIRFQHNTHFFVAPPLIITKEEADKVLDIIYPIVAGLKPE